MGDNVDRKTLTLPRPGAGNQEGTSVDRGGPRNSRPGGQRYSILLRGSAAPVGD